MNITKQRKQKQLQDAKQVPRGYIKCDFFIVTHCIIDYTINVAFMIRLHLTGVGCDRNRIVFSLTLVCFLLTRKKYLIKRTSFSLSKKITIIKSSIKKGKDNQHRSEENHHKLSWKNYVNPNCDVTWWLFTLKTGHTRQSKITRDRRTDGRTNGRTRPLLEMPSRI